VKPVLSEVGCDGGLLLAGTGLGIFGTWSDSVYTASSTAGLNLVSLPLFLGIIAFVLGALSYALGKIAQSKRPETPISPTTVNRIHVETLNLWAGMPGQQPLTAVTGKPQIKEPPDDHLLEHP